MNHYYRLMVPTTIHDKPAPASVVEATRLDIKLSFADAFGGYTETVTTGGYLSESGKIIEETIYQIEASYETADDELVFRLAARIKADLKQESVMVRKDHKVIFV